MLAENLLIQTLIDCLHLIKLYNCVFVCVCVLHLKLLDLVYMEIKRFMWHEQMTQVTHLRARSHTHKSTQKPTEAET